MKKLLLLVLTLITLNVSAQDTPDWKPKLKKVFKFATFYGAVNGGTSLSDVDIYSVTDGLQTTTVETPFDYSITLGVRKIARFGYENKANTFYNGTENTFSDAATVGKIRGLEYKFQFATRMIDSPYQDGGYIMLVIPGSGTGTLSEPPALIVADMENPAKLHKVLVP